MGIWDYYSFSNDSVMDILEIPVHSRMPMIASADTPHQNMPLQEVIDTWYPLSVENPSEFLKMTTETTTYDLEFVGIILLFAGNRHKVPKTFIAMAIEMLAKHFTDEEYIRAFEHNWPHREVCMKHEIWFLAQLLQKTDSL